MILIMEIAFAVIFFYLLIKEGVKVALLFWVAPFILVIIGVIIRILSEVLLTG